MHHLTSTRFAAGAAALTIALLALAGVAPRPVAAAPGGVEAPPTSVAPAAASAPTAVSSAGAPGGAITAAPRVERIAGADRYQQAVLAAQAGFVRSDVVYLASGEGFADALSAAAVAGVHAAPLLLTPAGSLPAAVAAELQRLSPLIVVLVGGPASVSDEVMTEVSLAARGSTVVRVGGADRFAVSRALVSDAAVGVPRASRLFLATGATYPDALTGSPAAVRISAPVLLVNGAAGAPAVEELAVIAEAGAAGVTVLGGPASIGAGYVAGLAARLPVHRIGGADRFEVGATVNREAFGSAGTVYLASGYAFADALSGATLAARDSAPLYVVAPTCVPAAVTAELARLRPARVVLLGGPATLTPALEALPSC